MSLAANSPLRAAGRKAPSILALIVNQNSLAKVEYTIIRNGGDLRFTAAIKHTDASNQVVTYPIADNRGRVKVYGDLDQVVRQVVGIYGTITGLELNCANPAVMSPEEVVPSDPLLPTRRAKEAFEKMLPAVTREKDARNADVTKNLPFQNGTIKQQERYQESVRQRDAMVDLEAFVTAEIARLGALLPPA